MLSQAETDKLFKLYVGFPDRLDSILKQKNMHPKDLADKIGMPSHNVYNYIYGRSHPDMLNMIKLADALDISIDELVGLKVKL